MTAPAAIPVATTQLALQFKRFSGKSDQNPEAFTRQFYYAKAVNNWSDLHALYYAGMHLDGKAAEWFNNQEFTRWDEFEKALQERFGIDSTKMLHLLEKRKQGPHESVRDFADSLRTLSRYSSKGRSTNNALLLHFFMKGLKKEVREFVLFRRPNTFEEAVAEGEYYEDQFSSDKSGFSLNPEVATPPLSPKRPNGRPFGKGKEIEVDPLTELTKQMGKLSIQLAQWQRNPRSSGPPPDNRCYNCGLPGHVARDCPHPRRQVNQVGDIHYIEADNQYYDGQGSEGYSPYHDPSAYYYDWEAYAAEKRARDEATSGPPPPPARRFKPVPFDPEVLPDAPKVWPPGPRLPASTTYPRKPPPPPPVPAPAPRPPRPTPKTYPGAPVVPKAPAPRPPVRSTTAPAIMPHFNVMTQLDNTIARISVSELLRMAPVYRSQLREYLDEADATGTRRRPTTNTRANYMEVNPTEQYTNYMGQVDYFASPYCAPPTVDAAMHAEAPSRDNYEGLPARKSSRTPGRTSVVRVHCKVHGMPVVAVIDSGASTSVMSQAVARKLQHLHRLEETSVTFLTASGLPEKPWGILRDVPVQVGKLEMSMDVPVVAARNYDLLLGNDWLLQSCCQMCWDSRTLRVMVTPHEYDEIGFDVEGELKAPSPLQYVQDTTVVSPRIRDPKVKKSKGKMPRKPGTNVKYEYDEVHRDHRTHPSTTSAQATEICLLDQGTPKTTAPAPPGPAESGLSMERPTTAALAPAASHQGSHCFRQAVKEWADMEYFNEDSQPAEEWKASLFATGPQFISESLRAELAVWDEDLDDPGKRKAWRSYLDSIPTIDTDDEPSSEGDEEEFLGGAFNPPAIRFTNPLVATDDPMSFSAPASPNTPTPPTVELFGPTGSSPDYERDGFTYYYTPPPTDPVDPEFFYKMYVFALLLPSECGGTVWRRWVKDLTVNPKGSAFAALAPCSAQIITGDYRLPPLDLRIYDSPDCPPELVPPGMNRLEAALSHMSRLLHAWPPPPTLSRRADVTPNPATTGEAHFH